MESREDLKKSLESTVDVVSNPTSEMQEPSIDTDKLSYEIFSVLETNFLLGYDDHKLWIPKQLTSAAETGEAASIKHQRGKVCILSIDGGGMRGIVSGKALTYLEQALKVKSGNSEARIADFFDVAAGTGVGGIFTAMLFATRDGDRPIFGAEDTWRLLSERGKQFFRSPPAGGSSFFRKVFKSGGGGTSSGTAALERAMREAFSYRSRSLTLKDTLKPVLIPCYDLSSAAPFLFSRADALETDGYDFRLWEVCRATVAEPGRFELVEMQSVDGSTRCVAVDGELAMSNPTAAAITHVLHNKQEFPSVRGVEDLMVLSLGSSGVPLEACYEYERVKGWKAKEWARPVARIAGDGSADLVDQAVAMAFGQIRSSNYIRIQANGSSLGRYSTNTDSDPSTSNVDMLIGVAEEMLKQKNVESILFGGKIIGEQTNSEKLDWFAGELVMEHERRSHRIAPTVAFKQAAARAT